MPYTTINGCQRYFTQAGPSSRSPTAAPTLLLIHGLGSSSSFYQPLIPSLSSSFRCIAPDTPGSGLSDLGLTTQSAGSIADATVSVLDTIDPHCSFFIVGHSMGGLVASQLALKYSARVLGVVLIGPVHPQPAIAEVFVKRIEAVEANGVEPLADSVPTAATGSKATALQRAFIRSLILRTSAAGYMSLCQVIADAQAPDYASIKKPLLAIAGAEDRTVPLAGCERIVELYGSEEGDKKLEVLEGVGHWHCVEAPEEVAGLVREFVEGVLGL